MKDWYNDPPEYPEPPDWYLNLEAAIEDLDCPAGVRLLVEKAMDEYNAEQAKKYDIEPTWEH